MKHFVFSDNFHQIVYIIPAPSSPVPAPLPPLPAPSTAAPVTRPVRRLLKRGCEFKGFYTGRGGGILKKIWFWG